MQVWCTICQGWQSKTSWSHHETSIDHVKRKTIQEKEKASGYVYRTELVERAWLHYKKGMDDKHKAMRWFFIDCFPKDSDDFGKGKIFF